MTYRNRKLLDQAHDMPCMAEFPHECRGWQGCDPAHSDWSLFGRGKDHKSHDFAFAAMCHTAHELLSTFEREIKRMEWLRAFVGTQLWLWENERLKVVGRR